jgi:hypothetical protein
MSWAGPGVAFGTSPGGRGGGKMLKICAWVSAGHAKSHNPKANANGRMLPAPSTLVAAIFIGHDISTEIAANSSRVRRLSQPGAVC